MIQTSHSPLLEQSAAASLLHDLFRYPTHDQWLWLHRPEVQEMLEILARNLLSDTFQTDRLFPSNPMEYEEEYLSTFEVGVPHPPCPLVESHWNQSDPIPKILHENILFYKTFGLQIKESVRESFDHVRFQLEFYCYVLLLQHRAFQEDNNQEWFDRIERARQDFLQSHLLSWIPSASRELQKYEPASWPLYWVRMLEAFCIKQERYRFR